MEPNDLIEDDEYYYDEDDGYEWEPSCQMDCELCGCHGNCEDCDGYGLEDELDD